jgi:hypothetical protein
LIEGDDAVIGGKFIDLMLPILAVAAPAVQEDEGGVPFAPDLADEAQSIVGSDSFFGRFGVPSTPSGGSDKQRDARNRNHQSGESFLHNTARKLSPFTIARNRSPSRIILNKSASGECKAVFHNSFRLSGDSDHPTYAEAILHHAKAWAPERLCQRHPHLPGVGQRRENPLGFAFVWDRKREGKAPESGLFGRATVGRHYGGLADAEARVHDFVLETRWNGARLVEFRAVLEAHHDLDFGAEGFTVEFDGFFATAVEKEIGLNGSIVFLCIHDI